MAVNWQTMKNQQPYTVQKNQYQISSDPTRLDLDLIYDYLHHSYWSPGIPRAVVERAIENSLNFGLYEGEKQIGFARAITDFATYAYLADVFILPEYRGKGLGIWLIDCIVSCPLLAEARTFALGTRDAHDLYRKYGFENAEEPRRWMYRHEQKPWYDAALITDPPTREPEPVV